MLKVDRIISVSSEDPAWPAESLLKIEGKNKKWKCKTAGERNAIVVIQLEKASKIKSIDVGNENSAFIEILVGKSSLPDDKFKVLLVASSLMTLKEAKDLSNPNGVRFFKDDNFCKPEANEKWDRIKIVCSQPYNKHIQFGLSFIKFHGESGDSFFTGTTTLTQPGENNVTTLGRFLLKDKQEDDIEAGSTFASWKGLQNDQETSATSIRAATFQLLTKNEPIQNTPNKARKAETVKRNKPQHDSENGPEVKKAKKAVPITNDAGPSNYNASPSNRGAASSNNIKTPNKPPPPAKRKQYKPFSEFMKGVVFTISGIQNPLRGDVRSKALEMGAKYKPDWDDTCTHLVCAFLNTPKFNQVKGQGKIVKKEWIEASYSKRIRQPWRRFALDPSDTKKTESEEEVFEGDESENDFVSSNSNSTNVFPTTQWDQPGPSLIGDLPKIKAKKPKNQPPSDQAPPTPKKRTPKKSPAPTPNGKKKGIISPVNSSNKGRINNNELPNSQSNSLSKTVFLDLNLEKVEEDSFQGLADTDSEQDWMDDKSGSEEESSITLPYLPQQFDDLSFYIADDFSPSVSADLKRYILAHNGSIEEKCNQDTEYVITDKCTTVNEIKEEFPQIIGVKAEWVWRCHDENRLLPTSNFEL